MRGRIFDEKVGQGKGGWPGGGEGSNAEGARSGWRARNKWRLGVLVPMTLPEVKDWRTLCKGMV